MKKLVVWALFDSGNGCYQQASDERIDLYSIGIDRENKNDHFINLDLASYKRMFGDNELFDTLDILPKPDLIIASPPCESWSLASGMGGATLVGKLMLSKTYLEKCEVVITSLGNISIMLGINISLNVKS